MNTNYDGMSQFAQQNNEILIGEKILSQFENIIGRTPFFVYDKTLLQS